MINFSNSKNSNEIILNSPKELTKNKNLIKKEEKKVLNEKSKIKHNQNNNFIKYDENINEFFDTTFNELDYDEVIEEDKRTFCQYYVEKLKESQKIINCFFIYEVLIPKSLKIAVFILTIDLYFLINGIFYSDSYISEIFNSTEKETLFSFIPRSINRFTYSIIVTNIIGYITQLFFIEEIKVKKILSREKEMALNLKIEMTELLKSSVKKIKIFTVINFIIIIFSWYYISCLNNVYPNISKEWIKSSIFIIVIVQIIPFIFVFLGTSFRYISIKCESEKLFKLSVLIS